MQAGAAQIHSLAAHRDPFCQQERPLPPALREASIGADDTMPWQVVVDGGKDEPDQARRHGIDVAVGAYKPRRDGAHPANDARGALLRTRRIPSNRRRGWQTAHSYIVVQKRSEVPGLREGVNQRVRHVAPEMNYYLEDASQRVPTAHGAISNQGTRKRDMA
jgi:hypothetical protein